MSPRRVRRIKRRRRIRRLLIVVLAILLGLLGLAGWFGISAWQAKQEADAALTAATGIQESISTGDMDALDGQITELTDHVHGAYAQTSSTIWTLASHIPYIGVDVTAVRTAVTAMENICVQAMPGLQDALRAVNGIQVENGTMSIQEFAPPPAEFTTPVVTLTAEERALFTDKLARVPQDVNFTPDFPRTGEIAQAMWQQSTQQTVDGSSPSTRCSCSACWRSAARWR